MAERAATAAQVNMAATANLGVPAARSPNRRQWEEPGVTAATPEMVAMGEQVHRAAQYMCSTRAGLEVQI
jgi:hypothetical protein